MAVTTNQLRLAEKEPRRQKSPRRGGWLGGRGGVVRGWVLVRTATARVVRSVAISMLFFMPTSVPRTGNAVVNHPGDLCSQSHG